MSDLTKDSGDAFLEVLATIGAEDAAGLKKAAESYGNSWKSRGGVGAFMMLARKWDRMQNRVSGGVGAKGLTPDEVNRYLDVMERLESGSAVLHSETGGLLKRMMTIISSAKPYDIFHHIAVDQRAEGVIDDVRDLRRYLMLVEAEMRARGFDATHRDNK